MESTANTTNRSSFVPLINVNNTTRIGRDINVKSRDSNNLSCLSSIHAMNDATDRARSDSYRYGNWMTSNNNTTLSGSGTGTGLSSGLVGGNTSRSWAVPGTARASPAPRRVDDWRSGQGAGDGLDPRERYPAATGTAASGGGGVGSTGWHTSRWAIQDEDEAVSRRMTIPRWGSTHTTGLYREDPVPDRSWRNTGSGGTRRFTSEWSKGCVKNVWRAHSAGRGGYRDDGMIESPSRCVRGFSTTATAGAMAGSVADSASATATNPTTTATTTDEAGCFSWAHAGSSPSSSPSTSGSDESSSSSSSTLSSSSSDGIGVAKKRRHSYRKGSGKGKAFTDLRDFHSGTGFGPGGSDGAGYRDNTSHNGDEDDDGRATIASMLTNDIDIDTDPVVPPEMVRRAQQPIFQWNRHPSHDIVIQLLMHRGIYLPRYRELVDYHMAQLFLHYLDVCREGAYFVYYAANKWPKERFFRIRMLQLHRLATRSEPVPQLVITMHESGVAIVDAIPLDFLVGVTTTPRAPCFRPFLESPNTILGCREGRGHRARLPVDGCLTLWFYDRSSSVARSVDILTCDAKIYDIWTKAFMGIVSVNSSSVVQIGIKPDDSGAGSHPVHGPVARGGDGSDGMANEQRMVELTRAAQEQVQVDMAEQARRGGTKRS